MRDWRGSIFLPLLVLSCFSRTEAGKEATVGGGQNGQAHSSHVLINPADIQWGPGLQALPPGAQMAVLDGNPSAAGAPFAVRLKFPDGYQLPPHWHPTDENVVVIQGVLMVGMGEQFSEGAAHEIREGGFAKLPAEVRHYAWTKGETVIQLYGAGPLEVNYVHTADDPRRQDKSK